MCQLIAYHNGNTTGIWISPWRYAGSERIATVERLGPFVYKYSEHVQFGGSLENSIHTTDADV